MPDAPFLEWLAMGGYAWFVWPSYALGLAVLAANLCLPLRRHRRLVREGAASVRRADDGGRTR